VAASRGKNAKLLKEGRVALQQASVSQLPFAENTFDLVTAVETQYYWPDLLGDMREILRVLRPGGTLIVIAESYKKGANEVLQWPVMKLLRSTTLSVDEERELFTAAGYSPVGIFEERSKGWICGTGTKPMPLK
jgi:ubiquinone/menaquinone biosynthesis C-methylase UbiE